MTKGKQTTASEPDRLFLMELPENRIRYTALTREGVILAGRHCRSALLSPYCLDPDLRQLAKTVFGDAKELHASRPTRTWAK